MSALARVFRLADRVACAIAFAAPVLDLTIRLYVANVFFRSGLTKIQSWDATLALFENEYAVPLLPPEVAAYLGTATELIVPIFLALGLGGRLAALVLFVFNLVAATSYPDISVAGLKDHVLWGWLLAASFFHGPGNLSLDHLIERWVGKKRGSEPLDDNLVS